MYSLVLFLHSLCRWFVVGSLVYAIGRSYVGWFGKKPFTLQDDLVRHTTANIAHIQLSIGLWLYAISPVIDHFYRHFSDAVHQREVRFFGMEHSLMMLTSIVLITIGSVLTKRKKTDVEKFKTLAIWFSMAFIIIFISIPWPFASFTANRPYFRSF